MILTAFGATACSAAPGSAHVTAAEVGATPTPADGTVALEPSVNWAQPLTGARKVTLTAASAAAGFVIPLPDARYVLSARPLMPRSVRHLTLSQTWVSPAREVALVFNHGQVTVLVGRASYKNARAAFRTELAAIRVGHARLGQVRGRPALVVQPRTDYTRSNPALVEFALDGLDINVISTKLGTSALLTIADAITTSKA